MWNRNYKYLKVNEYIHCTVSGVHLHISIERLGSLKNSAKV